VTQWASATGPEGGRALQKCGESKKQITIIIEF